MNDFDGPSGRDGESWWGGPPSGGPAGELVHGVPLYAWHELKAICEATGGQPTRLQFRLEPDHRADTIDVVVVSTIALRQDQEATIETHQRLHQWDPAHDNWQISLNGKHLAHQDRAMCPPLGHLGSIVARAIEDEAKERTAAPRLRQRQLHRDASHRTTGRSNWRPPRHDGPGPSRM